MSELGKITVPARFNGPPRSGNGGWTAGAVAEAMTSAGIVPAGLAVAVQLRQPPPLDTPMRLAATEYDGVEAGVELHDGDVVVAVARTGDAVAWTDPTPVDADTARGVEESYPGHRAHPFPSCFSCGPEREPGDGLRIFPGRVAEDVVASTWTPTGVAEDGAVPLAVTWAAMDCAGGWSSDLENRPMVLAQMTARVESPPQEGSTYVVVGRHLRTEGRKTWTASHLLAEDGTLLGQAEQLWIAVDWAVVQNLQES